MSAFEEATRLDPTDRAGLRTLTLDDGWSVGTRLHGGYLLAVCARAAVEAVDPAAGHLAPHAVTGTFLRAPKPGPAAVTVDVLRRGRSASQVRARLDQEHEPCVETAVTLGAPVDPDAAAAVTSPPVGLAAYDRCPRSPADLHDGRGGLALMNVVDTRLDPATSGFAHGEPSGVGRVTGWGELDDGSPWSPVSLLVALDLLPPASFDLGLSGWTPTMSLTAHVPGVPAPGPVALEQVIDHLAGDRMHETCRVWDARGRLVGIATQTAAVRL